MMVARKQPTPILAPDLEQIPAELKERYPRRWSTWRAEWDAEREKWNKIPCVPSKPSAGISTRNPWFSFDTAAAAYDDMSLAYDGGIGFNMLAVKGLVGIDLDGCVNADGSIAPWAQAVVDGANSYTEISPSGRGLRIFVAANLEHDWNNHEVGIEVYGGNAPRFLTVTGRRLPGTPASVTAPPADYLDGLAAAHRKVKDTSTELGELPDGVPAIIDEADLPALADLHLPNEVRQFLKGDLVVLDRSSMLLKTTIALYEATADDDGALRDDLVLSILYHNPVTLDVALRHRRDDPDRALLYLWDHHCLKARSKAAPAIADFDIVELSPEELAESNAAAEVNEQEAQAKAERFKLYSLDEFNQVEGYSYLIKGVLPQAELGVLFGESGSGKSFFTLDMAMHIALGREWRGKRVKQAKVVYICAEGANGFRKRVAAYCQRHGLSPADVPMRVIADAPNFLTDTDHKRVAKRIREDWGGADLIIVDTLAQTTPGGNENAGEDMGRALANLKTLRRLTGGMVLLVHHSGKDTTRGARGWSGLKAAADVEIEITRLESCRVAKLSKSKDDLDGVEFGFTLDVVDIGMDEDGDIVSSCVASPAEIDRTGPKRVLGEVQRLAMEVIGEIAEFQSAGISLNDVIPLVVDRLPRGENKRDTRRQRVRRALIDLSTGDDAPLFIDENGDIELV